MRAASIKSVAGWIVGIAALVFLVKTVVGHWVNSSAGGSTAEISAPAIVESTVPSPQMASARRTTATAKPDASTNADNQTHGDAAWEQKLDDILVSDSNEATKVVQILTLMPTVDVAAQVQLAQHLINLVQDDNYAMTGDLLLNPATAKDVSSILLNDLLNRNNELKLNMFLAIARNGDHPLKDEAKELLGVILAEDKGSNWAEWEKAVAQFLKDNQPPQPEPSQL